MMFTRSTQIATGLALLFSTCTIQPCDMGRKQDCTAMVRVGLEPSRAEENVLALRKVTAAQAISNLLGSPVQPDTMPTIALASSGGGYRSMIASLGFLRGLEKIGVLDASLYVAGLSGGSWTMASWLAQNKSLDNLKSFLKNQVQQNLALYNFDVNQIIATITSKMLAGQKVSLADVWGGMIGNVLFEGLPGGSEHICLSGLAAKINSGNYPFPIFTAALDFDNSQDYRWFEFNPFEIGCHDFKAWIPSSAFGKKFDNGISTDCCPEQSLSYLTGIFGSAYAANFHEVVEEIANNLPQLRDIRLSPAQVFSFTKNLESSGYAQADYYTLVDAGLDCNIPFQPLLNRPTDIIIVCDATDDNQQPNESSSMRAAEAHAKARGQKFPKIDYTGIGSKKMSIFSNESDKTVPTIIYFRNLLPFSTFKFDFTNQEFESLCNAMESAVIESKNSIINQIKRKTKALTHE
jgi:phospholipase A2